jgi:hypothetical protein
MKIDLDKIKKLPPGCKEGVYDDPSKILRKEKRR